MDAEPRAPDTETSGRSAILSSAEHGAIGCRVQELQAVKGASILDRYKPYALTNASTILMLQKRN
jgi:hypothetical protein